MSPDKTRYRICPKCQKRIVEIGETAVERLGIVDTQAASARSSER
jgi:hypothetical protein